MAQIIQTRGDTAANMQAQNPILADRQECIETDTLKRKIGNGVVAWNDLPYANGGVQGGPRGFYDASGGAYPDPGTGSGPAGAIVIGDFWDVSVASPDLDADGNKKFPLYSVVRAKISIPGQTDLNWKITP